MKLANKAVSGIRMRLPLSQREVCPPCSTGTADGPNLRKEQLLALARDGDIEAASDLWREFGIPTGVNPCS